MYTTLHYMTYQHSDDKPFHLNQTAEAMSSLCKCLYMLWQIYGHIIAGSDGSYSSVKLGRHHSDQRLYTKTTNRHFFQASVQFKKKNVSENTWSLLLYAIWVHGGGGGGGVMVNVVTLLDILFKYIDALMIIILQNQTVFWLVLRRPILK